MGAYELVDGIRRHIEGGEQAKKFYDISKASSYYDYVSMSLADSFFSTLSVVRTTKNGNATLIYLDDEDIEYLHQKYTRKLEQEKADKIAKIEFDYNNLIPTSNE